jgi:hypothetical protein
MIPKDKIFDLFKENKSTSLHEDFMDNPYIKIGMFGKTIQNNEVFFQKLKKYYITNNISYNENDIDDYSKFITYNRAFFYISQIDIDNSIHIDALLCYNYDILIKNINQILIYFEEIEEYEKCAHLFKIKTILEDYSK